MKTICNVPHDWTLDKQVKIIVEIGDFGIAIMILNDKSNHVIGLSVYGIDLGDDIYENILSICKSIEINRSYIREIRVYYNFKASLFVPQKYYNPMLNEHMINLMYGEGYEEQINIDLIKEYEMLNLYRVPNNVINYFKLNFPEAKYYHSTSHQISKPSEGYVIRCLVFYDAIKLILQNNGSLIFTQQYQIKSPENVVYYLLNCCKQHDIEPTEININVSGMISIDSALFEHIYNYFLNVTIEQHDIQFSFIETLDQFPKHFFTHLTELTQCEL